MPSKVSPPTMIAEQAVLPASSTPWKHDQCNAKKDWREDLFGPFIAKNSPVTTPMMQRPWPLFKNAHLVVMGLAFLDGHKMTIDIDAQRVQITS